MIECGEDLRFALETRQPIGIPGEVERQDLDCDVATEFGVARAVDFAHAACTDQGADFVSANRVPGATWSGRIIST